MSDHGASPESHSSSPASSGGKGSLIEVLMPDKIAEGVAEQELGPVVEQVIEPGIVETGAAVLPPDASGPVVRKGGKGGKH